MLAAVKGVIRGNTVVIEDEDIKDYEGKDAIVTILDYPNRKIQKSPIELGQFVIPTERGQRADEYVRELRDNDRI